MRRLDIITLLVLACAVPASAAELPARKSGLWQVETRIGNADASPRVVQQCIDAATDQMLQSSAGPFNAAACAQHDVKETADATTIDFKCTVGGKSADANTAITGSMNSAYTMNVTAEGEALPGGKMTMTTNAKWLGACAADQKPGDVVFSNGVKVNVPELQKRSASSIPQQ